jgi:hypothetical protein
VREIGSFSLVAALALSAWVIAAAWRGLRAPAGPWAASARHGVGAVFALVTVLKAYCTRVSVTPLFSSATRTFSNAPPSGSVPNERATATQP